MIKHSALLLCCLALCGCAAKLTFVDRTDGIAYRGTTGGTSGGAGQATAQIAGADYTGEWLYQSSGGSYSLANFGSTTNIRGDITSGLNTARVSGVGTTAGSASMLSMPTMGNGMIHLRSADGSFLRCVFSFNVIGNSGIGGCQRNDGREFDLLIKR